MRRGWIPVAFGILVGCGSSHPPATDEPLITEAARSEGDEVAARGVPPHAQAHQARNPDRRGAAQGPPPGGFRGGPGDLYLQEDKALTKKLLAFDGIGYPNFAVFTRDADLETGGNLRMPLFVKPLRMDASIGIGAKSLVHSATEMMKRVVARRRARQAAD